MSTRNYEAMFILENNAATADFEATSAQVDDILQKHGATIVSKEKWDERKLAYEIKGHRRGTYYLTYFTAPATAIDDINEDVQLSETILRHLVVSLDTSIEEHVETGNVERERLAEDSRKNSLGGWGGRRGGSRGAPPPRKTSESGDAAPAASAPAEAPAPDASKPEKAAPEPAAPEKPEGEEKQAEAPPAAPSEGPSEGPADAEPADAEPAESAAESPEGEDATKADDTPSEKAEDA